MSVDSRQVPGGELFPRGVRWVPDFYDNDGFQHMTVHDSHNELLVELAVRPDRATPQFEQMWKDWLDREDPLVDEAALRLA